MQGPYWIRPDDTTMSFPDPALALQEPDGLLAIGGDLSTPRLLSAYRHGIFPWYSEDQPILWWSPDPRLVLYPERLKISRSLAKRLRQGQFQVTFDQCFAEVIDACAAPRAGSPGTWITSGMRDAYLRLHRDGYAHSVECRVGQRLVGGLYGVALGQVFFGESMFSRVSDASKVALAHLVEKLREWRFALIDCQVYSRHLESLGAELVARSEFVAALDELCPRSAAPDAWHDTPATQPVTTQSGDV